MILSKYPRILIYGQPFNDFSGGGITLTNLFKGWPSRNIAVIAHPYMLSRVTYDICNTYYQIGIEEYHWKFPFNLFKQTYSSGLIIKEQEGNLTVNCSKSGPKQFLSNLILNPIVNFFGLSHCNSRIEISLRMKKWLSDYDPEILYFQISSRESIAFAIKLIECLKIPSVIHMMDDWPSTISLNGLFRNYWKRTIDSEFRQLLNKVDLHMSISDAMSEEYAKRYNKDFIAFHNPVEIGQNNLDEDTKNHDGNIFRILYIGRIGTANEKTIISFAKSISQLSDESIKIEFNIFTNDINSSRLKDVTNLKNVNISSAIAHKAIPSLLKKHDLLLLPLDFTGNGILFAQYSIPTKASEYMLSGTPVLVYAPKETAVSKFFKQNKCGYCLNTQSDQEVRKALHFLIENPEYRKEISTNAVNIAKEKFNAENVRKEFQNILINMSKQ